MTISELPRRLRFFARPTLRRGVSPPGRKSSHRPDGRAHRILQAAQRITVKGPSMRKRQPEPPTGVDG